MSDAPDEASPDSCPDEASAGEEGPPSADVVSDVIRTALDALRAHLSSSSSLDADDAVGDPSN